MYRAGLILAGLVGGMVTFGGSALAVAPNVTAESVQTPILPGPSNTADDGRALMFGEGSNLGQDNDVLDLDLANELLRGLGILSN
ncbi:hypothetical protein [Nonomuraea sp. NPDC049480]|uniref:hypothetical protein n=1 Tax=Nonomuraea sp. NPDC049480 TaxID=3364353 RepID=UPI0037B45840